MGEIKYEYRNLPISGGGYVTGLEFSKKEEGVLYARTDIGGVYRYNYTDRRWRALMCSLTPDDIELAYPLAIALREGEKRELLIAGGTWIDPNGKFAITDDDGVTFVYKDIPASVHGNRPGRGAGKRLDIADDGKIYFASQSKGLLRTCDDGNSWEKLPVPEINTTFVYCGHGDNDNVVVIGCSGKIGESVNKYNREHALYVSYDGGDSFEKLWVPEYPKGLPGMQGYVAYRYAAGEKSLYVTFFGTAEEPGMFGLDAYGTDSVHALTAGKLVRYDFENGKLVAAEDITPSEETFADLVGDKDIWLDRSNYPLAFGGLDVSQSNPKVMVLGVTAGIFGCCVLRSEDAGKSWKIVMHGFDHGTFAPKTPYLLPENNDGNNVTHWLNDIKINPFNPDEVWYVTGTGTFVTRNFMSDNPVWTDDCDGLEETVHIGVYSLPMRGAEYDDRDIKVVDAVGDIGAFVFNRYDEHCASMVKNETGSGYVTSMNADYQDAAPENIVITPRGNWRGSSVGGVILSENGGDSFRQLQSPRGFGEITDQMIDNIERPNTNSGWTAISACSEDGSKTIVWQLCEVRDLPVDAVFYTRDDGKTWNKSVIKQLENENYGRIQENRQTQRPATLMRWEHWPKRNPNLIKIMADRVDPKLFYGFGDHFRVYISADGCESFKEYEVPEELPIANLGTIEGSGVEIRGEAGKRGVFYIAAGESGLWRMIYDADNDVLSFERVLGEGETARTVGIGIGRNADYRDYANADKTLYISGKIKQASGELKYGFYRSEDDGKRWDLISDDRQHFGQIRSIDGDCRVFGRFFIASGTMGLIMGEEAH